MKGGHVGGVARPCAWTSQKVYLAVNTMLRGVP